jgi:hypothetical protein
LPDYAAKKARIEHLYAISDREVAPDAGDPEVIFCVDESGPLNLQPHPGRLEYEPINLAATAAEPHSPRIN